MVFNSWSYLLFLLLAVPLAYKLKGSFRIWFLFGISVLFYGFWRFDFALIMLFSTWIDYFVARRIFRSNSGSKRKGWLILSLSVNLGLLVFFKYAYFIDDNLNTIFHGLGWNYQGISASGWSIILPLGISFYTFQTISYTIDVYRGISKPIQDFALFGTFVTFWPQLIAGPILRVGEVIPQLIQPAAFEWSNVSHGLYRVIVGLFKKVFLADNIAGLVDDGFLIDPSFLSAGDVWMLTILFGFQIYFDFSAYSDIAIGSAKMIGIHFPENFNWPYLAKTPREFWQRWHISLSSWIRDYLYLPLQGLKFKTESTEGIDINSASTSNVTEYRAFFALFVTWFVMGFWHGAGWNFACWGLLHATMIYVFRKFTLLQKLVIRSPMTGHCLTFLMIMSSWIPFRSDSLQQTMSLYGVILNPLRYNFWDKQLHVSYYAYALLLVISMLAAYQIHRSKWYLVHQAWIRPLLVPIMVFFIIVYMQQVVQFIYFQF